jgi:hypothetical protein
MTRVDLGDLGTVEVSPMHADEYALVLDSWLRSTTWRRRDIVRVVDAGGVLVARDDAGLALGWLAMREGRVAHGYCKSSYRGYGVMRALWVAAGRPEEIVHDAMRRARRVLEHLKADRETT